MDDPDPEVRFECLRWIADAVLTSFSADVEQMLTRHDLDYRLFEAVLATWNTLRGNPGAGVTDAEVLVERVTNAATPARLKGYALRLVPATHPKLTVPLLRELLAADDAVLSLEVVRTLAARNADDARAVLAEIAADESRDAELARRSHRRSLRFGRAASITRCCCNSPRMTTPRSETKPCARCVHRRSMMRRGSRSAMPRGNIRSPHRS